MNQSSNTVDTPSLPVRRFVWQRFAALVRVDWAERWRTYVVFATVILVVHLLMILFNLGSSLIRPVSLEAQVSLYYLWLLAFSCAFGFVFFSPLQRKEAVLLCLVRPASTLEKWLHHVLMLLVFLPVIYTLIFWLLYAPANAVFAAQEMRHALEIQATTGQPLEDQHIIGFQLLMPLMVTEKSAHLGVQLLFVWVLLMLSGFGAYAHVKFKRSAGIKALGLALLLLLISLMMTAFSSYHVSFVFDWIDKPPTSVHMGVLPWVTRILFWVVPLIALWVASFYAWRERDVA